MAFVEDGIGVASPWCDVRGQVLLGSERFANDMKRLLEDVKSLNELPRAQRFVNRPALEALFGEGQVGSREERNQLVKAAHLEHGYTLTEIAAAIGLHYTSVSKIINAVPDEA